MAEIKLQRGKICEFEEDSFESAGARALEKLQEYRQALTTSAVTGKINVVDIRLANIN